MRSLTLLAGLLVAAAGCGGGSDTTTGPPTQNPPSTSDMVTVGNNFFSPSTTTVPPGTTVTWTWAANATTHNVTFSDAVHSNTQSSGTYTQTFNTAGTFPYHCTIHGMQGTITVAAPASGGTSGTGGTDGSGSGGGAY
jgi:plastocyanin